jgi:hypothetical protein
VDSKMIIEPLCEKYVRRGILFDKSFILKKWILWIIDLHCLFVQYLLYKKHGFIKLYIIVKNAWLFSNGQYACTMI